MYCEIANRKTTVATTRVVEMMRNNQCSLLQPCNSNKDVVRILRYSFAMMHAGPQLSYPFSLQASAVFIFS